MQFDGKKLRVLRKKKRLSQLELARRCTVSGSRISDWENGLSIPYPGTIRRLAEILECDTSELVIVSPIPSMRELRLQKGLTQDEAAGALGISRSNYTIYELGSQSLPERHYETLATCFNVSLQQLLDALEQTRQRARDGITQG